MENLIDFTEEDASHDDAIYQTKPRQTRVRDIQRANHAE